MHVRRATLMVAILLTACRMPCALAADDCSGPSSDCVAVGHWNFSLSLGVGVRTNPVVHGSDIPLVVIPQFSYYGKRVFIENLDLGVTLVDRGLISLKGIAQPRHLLAVDWRPGEHITDITVDDANSSID